MAADMLLASGKTNGVSPVVPPSEEGDVAVLQILRQLRHDYEV
jgi:hypothetical protein